MSFAITEAQSMLSDMVTRLLAKEGGFEARRARLAEPAADRLALWPVLAEQGILGAAFTEQAGGYAGSARDLAVIMEAAGERLVVEPLLAAALCGRLLHAAGDDDQVGAVIAGERVLAFAHMEGPDPFGPRRTVARRDREVVCLSGSKIAVRHGDLAHGFVVTAMLDEEVCAFLVEAGTDGLQRENFRLIDGASAATLHMNGVRGRLLAGAENVADTLLWAMAALAAEATGIARALNAATFNYMNIRRQFGVTLAQFQALQHRAADMFAAAEEMRCLATRTIDAIDSGETSRFALASAVKALCDERGMKIGHEAVQLHGGMGVSDELDISHYMRRLAAIRAEFGSADTHRAQFATLTLES